MIHLLTYPILLSRSLTAPLTTLSTHPLTPLLPRPPFTLLPQVSRAQKLEASNADLLAKLAAFEDTKIQLAMAEAQVAFLEAERTQSRAQLDDMERELQRRESVVAMLMEKDALRTAELEKMQRQEEAKRHKEAINVSAFEETPTSGAAHCTTIPL